MHDHHPHGVAAPATRRATIAAALVAAAALWPVGSAGAKSSCKKKARKKVDTACARIRDECLTFYNLQCADSSDPDACRRAIATCCGHLESCNFTEHVTCLTQAQ